jgi:hypothetical protein
LKFERKLHSSYTKESGETCSRAMVALRAIGSSIVEDLFKEDLTELPFNMLRVLAKQSASSMNRITI